MTPETYLARVRLLLPVLRERADHAERLRRLPDETFADFQDAGLFRCLQPKRYGGYELDPGTLYQAVMEIGAVCGSSAWILGVIGVHNWHLALFAPEAQDDVWGKDTSIQLSTSLAPTGTVESVDGGFRLRGRWPFSSGCDFCQWAVLGGAVPSLDKNAPPDVRTFLVPRSDYVIDDTWHAVGLRSSTTGRCTGCPSGSFSRRASAHRRSASRWGPSRPSASRRPRASHRATRAGSPRIRSRSSPSQKQRPR